MAEPAPTAESPLPFIPLRVHTQYSLAEGAIRIKGLMAHCQTHAIPAVAMTDSANLFGAMDLSLSAKDAGVQPILGLELPISLPPLLAEGTERRDPTRLYDRDRLVLLAQTEAGWLNLMALVSEAYLDSADPHGPLLPLSRLTPQTTRDLICLTGGLDGPLSTLLAHGKREAAGDLLDQLHALFGDRLYVEITRTGRDIETRTEPLLVEMADHRDLPLVATNPAYFLTPDLHEAHDALLCIAHGAYLSQGERPKAQATQYLKSADEMRRLFADLPDALDNTAVIAQRCAHFLGPVKPILPRFPTDQGRTESEELAHQAREGLRRRLDAQGASNDTQAYWDRLEFELGVIDGMGFPGYFLIVSDFIKWAKSQGIPVGPGRGSGAASVVAWSLTITDLDPLRFNLLFERFLNPERVSMPDFDVDFCQERRDEVIRYVRDRYGHDRVAAIITFGALKAKAVIKDVGRVMQMSYGQVDRLSKLIPDNPANPVPLSKAIAEEPELRAAAAREEQVADLFAMAQKLEGLYRHASTHAAGIVIGDRPLPELVPLYRDPRTDMPVSQFNMKHVEMAGLVKFDFLGLKTLTVIQEALRLAAKRGHQIDLETLPLDDPASYRLLARAESTGVFQLESSGMKDVLRQLRPDRFEDIIALVALYRPGPMDNIPRYIKIKNGQEQPDYMHPLLQPILEETLGIMIYQEQVMQAAQILAGYSLGGADLLRRAMGKKIKEAMDAEREKFTKGAVTNGVDGQQASAIFDQIAKFAGYGFNKAHAAAYALIAYQTAYLKANHPVAFMAATMTFDLNDTDKLGFFKQEVDRLGIPVLPPDINASQVLFDDEALADGRFALRYALAGIKGVGKAAMEAIVAERQANGPFKDIGDFAARAPAGVVNRKLLENLIRAGAFDSLEPSRRRLFDQVDKILRHTQAAAVERESQQESIFGLLGDGEKGAVAALPPLSLDPLRDWPLVERLEQERLAIGFFLSAHPLDAYGDGLDTLRVSTLAAVRAGTATTCRLAVILGEKRERVSARGNRFAFVQISDASGAGEVTVFSEILATAREVLTPGRAVLLRAEVQRAEGGEKPKPGEEEGSAAEVRLTATGIEDLETTLANHSGVAEVRVETPAAVDGLRTALATAQTGRTIINALLPLPDGREVRVRLPAGYRLDSALRTAISDLEGVELKVS